MPHDSLHDAFAALEEQLELILPNDQESRDACDRIRAGLTDPPTTSERRRLRQLVLTLTTASADGAGPALRLIEDLLPRVTQPWTLLAPLLKAEDLRFGEWATAQILTLVEAGTLVCDRRVLRSLADLLVSEDGPFSAPELQTALRDAIRRSASVDGDALEHLLLHERDPGVRRLAARLLDLDGRPPDEALVRRLLGDAAWTVFAPFLVYTRANHVDLTALSDGRPASRAVVDDFSAAVRDHGEELVRRILAELGWSRVNRGLRIGAFVELLWPGTAPLVVRPDEVALFDGPTPPIRGRTLRIVTARGGAAVRRVRRTASGDPVDRFRRLNIVHAELLCEILETAPADRSKVEHIIELMDVVVKMFHELFADAHEAYTILPDVWRDLRDRTTGELSRTPHGAPLSAELTRLVLAFEDPANLGEVRTVHGLKRLLHQQGLKLGFQLVDTSRSPDATVDLLLAADDGVPLRGPSLRFAELEAAVEADPDPWLPHPVRLAADGLARQLLYGTTTFPGLDIFIFGNEVQYYVSFRNHPAFLRVDFSPPQRGGMLDLEYYGVSNYETDIHPDPSLDGIRRFYRALDMDVRLDGTRLFVRYDKERCHDLDDLIAKVSGLMNLAPHLMNVDWVMGSLQLPAKLRARVSTAWADRFARTGLFPADAVLTENRAHVLMENVPGPTGVAEKHWTGEGPYRDHWSGPAPDGLWEHLAGELTRLGLPAPPSRLGRDTGPLALLDIERHVLEPVRRGLRAGRLVRNEDRLEPAPARLYRPEHAAEALAVLLDEEGAALEAAIALSRPLAALEKFTPFETVGAVGGLRVDRSRLSLHGGVLQVYAGRDEHGAIRLGIATLEDVLAYRRSSARAAWRSNRIDDADRLWTLLRSANYVGDAPTDAEPDTPTTIVALKALAARRTPTLIAGPEADETVLNGLPAAPGRAVGRVLFGTAGRRPEDLVGNLLVAREIRPEDGPYLCRSSGILSTGGAVLSHAALLAVQFGKPAMVADARWEEGAVPSLQFQVTRCRVERGPVRGLDVCRRMKIATESGRLVEGDLCILDAGEGMLQILGQDADTITLWQGFRDLVGSHATREQVSDPRRILEIRSEQLRARHQIKKALLRIGSAPVARYALEEIVIGSGLARLPIFERAQILGELMANQLVAGKMQPWLGEITRRLADRYDGAARQYRELAPSARTEFEVLGWRLRSLQRRDTLQMALDLQRRCSVQEPDLADVEPHPGDDLAIRRLRELRTLLRRRLGKSGALTRHILRRLDRLHEILPEQPRTERSLATTAALSRADARARLRLADEPILEPAQCGLETNALLGWKGANLAEIDRLAGPATVPPWYAVSDAALRRLLAQPATPPPAAAKHLGSAVGTLGEAIDGVLALEGIDRAAQARLIQDLWQAVPLPEDLVGAIARAHRRLQGDDNEEPHVALRSSSCDEDSETSMQAGVYDTFLYVTGLRSVLDHLRLTWSGLWNARALDARAACGDPSRVPHGGVIVQRMVAARVSGVLQTVNAANGDLRELLISVGLGLGEGIVSGRVAADLVTVVKDQGPDHDPLHFNYLTNDKLRQVVFDRRRGSGTRLEETLYHQRLRPALEYSELSEVVRKALLLEEAYGYPLDIEFGLEGPRLWLLQARPLTAVVSEHATTRERYPLAGTRRDPQPTGV